jgi:O-glycosyl hydrolase
MMQRLGVAAAVALMVAAGPRVAAQALDFTAVEAEVDFGRALRAWDGFGFNYVETAQTRDYADYPQEYGGFSILSPEDRARVVDLVFSDEGLKVGLVKMFLDPFHQSEAGGAFDHATTTANMRAFVRAGLERTRADGRDLTIITTLYGPPAYMTKQKAWRGRDLDPAHADDLSRYLVDWVRFLREEESLPVAYLSLHNEGEDWRRWNQAGITDYAGHDFNLYWPPEQVRDYLKRLPPLLKQAGLGEVGVTPGETSNWYRFGTWGYAEAIADDPEALAAMALITSHGFYNGNYGRWFGEHKSTGIDLLREKRPELHAWVTSTSWSKMDSRNIKEMHGNIYTAKVNGIIPWAGIQRPPHWVEGDPNPGSAFYVSEDGKLEVRRGYYVYKQISRAGQPGMAVAWTRAMDSEIAVIGFAANGTANPDAAVLVNIDDEPRTVHLAVSGSSASTFRALRTTDDDTEAYANAGRYPVEAGAIVYEAPPGSVTTFFGEE